MSIKKYISELNYDQLAFAKETIELRIFEYENSKKVVLFVVSDAVCNVGCYAEKDWELAKAHQVKLIQDSSFTPCQLNKSPPHSPT